MRSCLICLLLLSQGAVAAENWEQQRDRDGIQVYTRDVDGSKFKAVKSTMTIAASLRELVALVRDAAACPDWAALCKMAESIDELSETEMYVYTLNDLPWPVADRDAIAHVLWSQDPSDLAVTMIATVVSDKLPAKKGIVRLSYGTTSWHFKPTADGQVDVTSIAHVDPGGATPAWLSNRLLVDSPFDTMAGMRKIIKSNRYENSAFEFLSEP